MKKLFFLALFSVVSSLAFAQKPSPEATATGKIGGANVSVKYCQPAVKGRNVWDPAGSLAPYGKVWRTGANEATTITFDTDVKIEGKALAAGTYGLFTIPGEKEWVIIFNKNGKQWGSYSYKEADDALRVTVPAKAGEMSERFTIAVNKSDVSLAWDKVKVAFGVK